jgi:hypothetical protein
MSPDSRPVSDEMAQAQALPQLDATALVDTKRLEAAVKDMYRHVARGEEAELHFEVGRGLAERLGYPGELLDAIPAEALASFAGVGHHLDLAALQPGEKVLDLGSGSGTDVFSAAVSSARPARSSASTSPTSSSTRLRGFATSTRSHRSSSSRRTSRSSPSMTRASTRSSPTASSTCRPSRAGSSRRRRASCGPEEGWRSPTSSADERSRSERGATSSCGPPASPGRSHGAATSRPSRRRACRSSRSARTTTASSRSGPSMRAASTRSRASRWSP